MKIEQNLMEFDIGAFKEGGVSLYAIGLKI